MLRLATRRCAAAARAPCAFARLRPRGAQGAGAQAASAQALLPCEEDRYGGRTVDARGAGGAFRDAAAFEEALCASVRAWRREGVRGVWLRVGLEQAALVPVAAAQGFEFHHAEAAYLMMARWLPEEEPSTLPKGATSHVGVGAFVVQRDPNGGGKLLVVRERRGPAAGKGWKLITGLADGGEAVQDAARREVLEETGVRARFVGVTAIRRALGTHVGGKDDTFFMCVLEAAGGEIRRCDVELEGARWMDVGDFLAGGDGVAHDGGEGLWPRLYRDAWRCFEGDKAFLEMSVSERGGKSQAVWTTAVAELETVEP